MVSLPYAPPEAILAMEAGHKSLIASPAVDVWALGVIAFELLTQSRIFPVATPGEDIVDRLAGRLPLPWESPDWRKSRHAKDLVGFKSSILQCLNREPEKRPSTAQLEAHWNSLFAGATAVT
jgi:serine/threonine protein kinase